MEREHIVWYINIAGGHPYETLDTAISVLLKVLKADSAELTKVRNGYKLTIKGNTYLIERVDLR